MRAFDDDRLIVIMSVWESREALRAFVYVEERVEHLRTHGPTPCAFTFRTSFAAPDLLGTQAPVDDERPLCPSG